MLRPPTAFSLRAHADRSQLLGALNNHQRAAASYRVNPSILGPSRFAASRRSPIPRSANPSAGAGSDASLYKPEQLLVSEPLSKLDVDHELWQVLDLCTDEELELVYDVLHSSSPFSPVVKSLVTENEPAMVELRGRVSVMHKVESRFRFLAADSAFLLQGKRPGYRDTLLAIRDRVNVPCSGNLSTWDLETEIFMHVTQHCLEYVQGEEHFDPAEAVAVVSMTEGDGMGSSKPKTSQSNWLERAIAPIRFGMKELAPTALKLGSAMTVTLVGQRAAQQLASQLVCSHLRYQAAARMATGLARGAVAGWSKTAVLEAAQRGLTVATARYSAVQGALSFLGPVMWGAFAMDLALKAIGTDYARVVRAVFILAQVRLLRTRGFTNPEVDASLKLSSLSSLSDDDDTYSDPGGAFC